MTGFILKEGFVLVGDSVQDEDWMFLRLTRCAVVRRWGTTNGLGELFTKGPLSNTILDILPDHTRINKTEIKFESPCDEKAWAKWKHK